MISITTEVGGCGYVYVSWSVINNVPDDEMCGIGRVTIMLSSAYISMTEFPVLNSYNFTRLPDNTLFNVTVIGTSINERNIISPAFTSVKTMIIESMYVHMYVQFVINYM